MEDQLHINRKSIRQILLGDYGKTKICVKIYHQVRRMASFCHDSETLAENREVPKIVHPFDSSDLAAAHFPWMEKKPAVASWMFQYDNEIKRYSMACRTKLSPRPKTFACRSQQLEQRWSLKKQGNIHQEFVPQGKRMNFEIYGKVLKGFVERISRVRTQILLRSNFFYCIKMPVLFVTELRRSFHTSIFLQIDSPNFILLLPNIRSA